MLLNNDSEVEPGFLEPLVEVACAEGVGPPARRSSSARPVTVWYAGASYGPGAATRDGTPGTASRDSRRRPPPFVTDRACGGAMLVPVQRSKRSALSTSRSSRTPRTRTGRCAPRGPGCGSWSSRRASSNMRVSASIRRSGIARHALLQPAKRARRRRAKRRRGQAGHAAPAGGGRGGVRRAGSALAAPRRRPARGGGRTSRRPSRPARSERSLSWPASAATRASGSCSISVPATGGTRPRTARSAAPKRGSCATRGSSRRPPAALRPRVRRS